MRSSSPALTPLGLPRVASGNFASVYEVRQGTQRWAVRCFLRRVSDQQARYALLSRHLADLSLPSLVSFEFQPQGIRIRGQQFPLVKMDWVDGLALHSYIERRLADSAALRNLAAQWRGLVNSLRGNRLAHGDLQHGNILVTPAGQMRLVDYDGMFVPALRGEPSRELGHSGYQHPCRSECDFNEVIDNFAALVIYLSLRALAADAGLWKRFFTGDNLILSASDFRAPRQSPAFQALKQSADLDVRALAARLEACCLQPLTQVAEFESVVGDLPGLRPAHIISPSLPHRSNAPSASSSSSQAVPWWKQAEATTLTPKTSRQPAGASTIPSWMTSGGTGASGLRPARPGPVRINPVDGAAMIWIAAGEFFRGSDHGMRNQQPMRRIHLDGFWIYIYPVTVAQYRQFCEATYRKMPPKPPWGWQDNHPIVNVTWKDAMGYCQWAQVRLPTEAEWEKAARGTDGRIYPWGDMWDASRLHVSRIQAKDAGGTSPVGSFPRSESPFGIQDMIGNVWEWCADWYGGSYYKTAPAYNPSGPPMGSYQVVRGGSWVETGSDPKMFQVTYRPSQSDRIKHHNFGFRCAASP